MTSHQNVPYNYLPSLDPETIGCLLEECCIQDHFCYYASGVVLPKASNTEYRILHPKEKVNSESEMAILALYIPRGTEEWSNGTWLHVLVHNKFSSSWCQSYHWQLRCNHHLNITSNMTRLSFSIFTCDIKNHPIVQLFSPRNFTDAVLMNAFSVIRVFSCFLLILTLRFISYFLKQNLLNV